MKLDGHVALVTGGNGGIGSAIADALADEGVRVAIVDREAVGEASPGRLPLEVELTEPEACRRAIERTTDHFGRLDILVNNAGVNDSVDLKAGPQQFAASLEKNLVHYYSMAHFAHSHLSKDGGSIVNIGSKVSVTGQGGTSGYAAAKGGVLALTREWAVELAPSHVRVNAVLPAEVWTGMYDRWLSTTPDPAAEKAKIEASIPLGRRFTSVNEIADAVVWLASPRSSHVTGQHIFVDGGYTHLDRRATL